MRARFVLGFLILSLVAVPWLASARHANLADPRDTDGLLDIKEVRLHGEKRPTWKTITFPKWGTERIFDRGFALVNIDARGDRHFEYYALVRSVGSGMRGELFRNRKKKSDYSVGSLKVWRPDLRSVSVRIPLRKLRIGDNRTYYRWFVQTLMTGSACPRVCIDRAPDEGAVRQPLAEPTPTITIEPSPTVTIEPSPTTSPTGEPTPSASPTADPSSSPTPTPSPS